MYVDPQLCFSYMNLIVEGNIDEDWLGEPWLAGEEPGSEGGDLLLKLEPNRLPVLQHATMWQMFL